MRTWLFASLFFAHLAAAKTVQNTYIRFDLPKNWRCGAEGLAWVCSPENSVEAREALIVITAKVAGPEDNLQSFTNYLRQPKTLVTKSKSSLSQPMSLNRAKINGVEWVQAVHLSSEVPNFTTKYLATVKDRLAVLMSFSADRDLGSKYSKVFDDAARSVQVDASKAAMAQVEQAMTNNNKTGVIGGTVEATGPSPPYDAKASEKKRKFIDIALFITAGAILILIVRKLL